MGTTSHLQTIILQTIHALASKLKFAQQLELLRHVGLPYFVVKG